MFSVPCISKAFTRNASAQLLLLRIHLEPEIGFKMDDKPGYCGLAKNRRKAEQTMEYHQKFQLCNLSIAFVPDAKDSSSIHATVPIR